VHGITSEPVRRLKFKNNYEVIKSTNVNSTRTLQEAIEIAAPFLDPGEERCLTDELEDSEQASTEVNTVSLVSSNGSEKFIEASNDIIDNLRSITSKTVPEGSPLTARVKNLISAIKQADPQSVGEVQAKAAELTAKLEEVHAKNLVLNDIDSSISELNEVIKTYDKIQNGSV
jgi:paraquat-inducible protein B